MVQADAAEVALILENKGARVLAEDEMVVFARRIIWLILAAEFPAHAEVDTEPEVVGKLEKHLFAAGPGGEQLPAGQERLDGSGVRVAEDPDFGSCKVNVENDLADSRIPLAAAVFDFGKFGHGFVDGKGVEPKVNDFVAQASRDGYDFWLAG